MPADDTLTDESRRTGTHDRSPLTWIVAIAVVALIAAAALFALFNRGTDQPGTLSGAPSESTAPSRTQLNAIPETARCVPPNVELLRQQSLAFDGVVRSIVNGEATLEPSRFYAGDATDMVVVQAPDRDLQALLAAVEFREGERYLVSATDGRVTLCGFSGPYTPELARLYDAAYGG